MQRYLIIELGVAGFSTYALRIMAVLRGNPVYGKFTMETENTAVYVVCTPTGYDFQPMRAFAAGCYQGMREAERHISDRIDAAARRERIGK
jgi:hypothetical protein